MSFEAIKGGLIDSTDVVDGVPVTDDDVLVST